MSNQLWGLRHHHTWLARRMCLFHWRERWDSHCLLPWAASEAHSSRLPASDNLSDVFPLLSAFCDLFAMSKEYCLGFFHLKSCLEENYFCPSEITLLYSKWMFPPENPQATRSRQHLGTVWSSSAPQPGSHKGGRCKLAEVPIIYGFSILCGFSWWESFVSLTW